MDIKDVVILYLLCEMKFVIFAGYEHFIQPNEFHWHMSKYKQESKVIMIGGTKLMLNQKKRINLMFYSTYQKYIAKFINFNQINLKKSCYKLNKIEVVLSELKGFLKNLSGIVIF